MAKLRPRFPVLAGLVLVLAGFVYELVFNNIPYPDPTPEIEARVAFHAMVASLLYLSGLLLILAGIAICAFRKISGKMRRNTQ